MGDSSKAGKDRFFHIFSFVYVIDLNKISVSFLAHNISFIKRPRPISMGGENCSFSKESPNSRGNLQRTHYFEQRRSLERGGKSGESLLIGQSIFLN